MTPTSPEPPDPAAPAGPAGHLGLRVTHRRYVSYSHAHYAGDLVDGAYSLGLFGDVATEVCIRTDGDEGLFASYSDVQFVSPVRAGDVLEVTAEVVRVGRRSRTLELTARVLARGRPEESPSSARLLDEPLVATTATGVVVVPATGARRPGVSGNDTPGSQENPGESPVSPGPP